jgi:hypothetical protein
MGDELALYRTADPTVGVRITVDDGGDVVAFVYGVAHYVKAAVVADFDDVTAGH